MGIPEYEAKRYEGAVKDGGTLLSVHCDTSEQIDAAKALLKIQAREISHRLGKLPRTTPPVLVERLEISRNESQLRNAH